ncbi:MAG TPA: hypothetical protein EYP49_19480 [Anaerolineae bacterium]|nr:hypothetical protein [Anaerolineae bacterium]
MNRQEIVQALKTLEEERCQAGLPDLGTLLDEEVYNASQSFHERFLCACGGDHTRLWAWVELAQDEFGVTFYLTELAGESTLGYRLETAWNVLRGRNVEFGLIFDPKDLPRLKALINRLP